MAKPNLLRDVAELPWPFGVAMAGLVFVGLRYVVPAFLTDSGSLIFVGLAPVARSAAPVFAALFLVSAAVSWWRAFDRRRLLDSRTGVESIRALPWERFEHLVGEAFRRRGYTVRENRSGGADRGIDLVLVQGAETVLVQCKRWNKPVGVPVVRELLGAVTAEGATRCILAAAGRFTEPARAFAKENGIELVDGTALERMIRSVQTDTSEPVVVSSLDSQRGETVEDVLEPSTGAALMCPACGSAMAKRTARRGPSAGSAFLGCTSYPRCRGTRPLP